MQRRSWCADEKVTAGSIRSGATSSLLGVALILLLVSAFMTSCTSAMRDQPVVKPESERVVRRVRASYYANKFVGRKTASGEVYNPQELTAAHRKLPFNSVVRLRNPKNGKVVAVRINDRGPFVPGRSFDVSMRAAQELGILRRGVATLEELSP